MTNLGLIVVQGQISVHGHLQNFGILWKVKLFHADVRVLVDGLFLRVVVIGLE